MIAGDWELGWGGGTAAVGSPKLRWNYLARFSELPFYFAMEDNCYNDTIIIIAMR